MWFFASTPSWYHTHTQTHTYTHKAHSTLRGRRLTQPSKYIFTPLAVCSQQLSLLHWMGNLLISKNYFPQCLFFSRIIHLQGSYAYWLNAIRLGSSDNNGVTHTHTHTHTQRQRDRERDRETEKRQRERQTDRQTDRQTERGGGRDMILESVS